jgi:hypothetical protein
MTNASVAALVRAQALFDGNESSPRFHKRASHIKFDDGTMGHAPRHSPLAIP